MRLSLLCALAASLVLLRPEADLRAQCTDGRVFSRTPETVALWELNGLGEAPGEVLRGGSSIPDLSGNGLDATVLENAQGSLVVRRGDPLFDAPPNHPDPSFLNTAVERASESPQARLVVENDGGAFEMLADQDFSVELYVHREVVTGAAQWGILAGTWHSRTLLDDRQSPDGDGAWYGYGFLQRGGQTGWLWVASPVNRDGSLMRTSFNEVRNDSSWQIPPGLSYVVASVNRSADPADGQRVRVYVNGVEVESLPLSPDWAFLTPPGYEAARFTFLTGVDDTTRNAFRTAPSGYAIDAARFQRKALTAAEVRDNYLNISDGAAAPATGKVLAAVLSASSASLVVGQCVRLNAEGSCAGAGRTITQYEYRVGGGSFQPGGPILDVAFDAPSLPSGVAAEVRITNDLGSTAEAEVLLHVQPLAPVAVIETSVGGRVVRGDSLKVQIGKDVFFDAGGSFTPVPDAAEICPLDSGQPLSPPPITAYEWDLDGDSDADSRLPSVVAGPFLAARDFIVTLTVRTEGLSEARTSLHVSVVDPGENSRVFHNTAATILHLEIDGLAAGPVGGMGDVGTIADLSANGLDLSLVDPAGGSFLVEPGAPQLAAGLSLAQAGNGSGPRGEIRDDGGRFELGPGDDFSFEIYLRPSPDVLPPWGDVAGTFRARTDGADSSPRYGWGIIKTPLDRAGRPGFAWFTPNQTPDEVPVFFDCEAEAFNYVACVVDRAARTSSVYVNGELASRRTDIDPSWDFRTPAGFPHARFYLFTREEIEGRFSNSPLGTEIAAVRLQGVALSSVEVAASWAGICAGVGANPPPDMPREDFRRGDADGNSRLELTDAVRILNFLFLGIGSLSCREAANSDDNRALELTDAVRILNFLFNGGPAPASPGPADCGPDPESSPSALGCVSYPEC